MKRLVCMTVAMAMTASLFVACGDDGEDEKTPPPAPTITLKDGDIKATHEIESGMSVVVNVAAPGGVADFTIRIDSPFLTPEELSALGLAAEMNLVTPATSQMAAGLKDTVVLAISKDLPFAHGRFCTTEGIENVIPLSDFRFSDFDESYGVRMADGPLAGLLARAVVVIGKDGKIAYTELVPEITQEPDYDKALAAVK